MSPAERRPRRLPSLPLCAWFCVPIALAGCGGGAPMLHPAHVLPPGEMMIGAGLSGQLALEPSKVAPAPSSSSAPPSNQSTLQSLTLAPGVSPWAAGRAGVPYDNEAGLTYAGRSFRLDGRHAFTLSKAAALSIGVGASALFDPHQPDGGFYGGGADLPILIGIRSTGGVYSFWFGPRGGFDIVNAHSLLGGTSAMPTLYDVTGKHFYAGLTAGARVGFRHIHLALELNAAYHAADGTFRASPTLTMPAQGPPASANVQQLSLTPAGALEVTF